MVVQQGHLRGKNNILKEDIFEAVRFDEEKVSNQKIRLLPMMILTQCLRRGEKRRRNLTKIFLTLTRETCSTSKFMVG